MSKELDAAVVAKVREIAFRAEGDYLGENTARAIGDCIADAILTALADPVIQAHVRQQAWLPIESAPKGVISLLWDSRNKLVAAVDWGRYCIHNTPKFTRWHPLPAPPEE